MERSGDCRLVARAAAPPLIFTKDKNMNSNDLSKAILGVNETDVETKLF